MSRTPPEEIERLKADANLVVYAARRRGYWIDRTQCSPQANPTHWILRRDADDAKILAFRTQRCWLYYDLRLHGEALGGRTASASSGSFGPTDGHGTIIDFIQAELGLSKGKGASGFGHVLRELRDFVGAPLAKYSPHRPAPPAPPATRTPSAQVAEAWNAARETTSSVYLESRALTPATLRHPRFAGRWRVDARGNVLFPHHDDQGVLTTFEIKNYHFTSSATGGVKTGLWRSNEFPGDRFIFLTEASINALSFHQLHPDRPTRYRSFAGRIGVEQLRLAQRELATLPGTMTVLLAFDGNGDPSGKVYEAQIRQILPPHLKAEVCHPPSGKDWNEHLENLDRSR
jgi:hypothetical protein